MAGKLWGDIPHTEKICSWRTRLGKVIFGIVVWHHDPQKSWRWTYKIITMKSFYTETIVAEVTITYGHFKGRPLHILLWHSYVFRRVNGRRSSIANTPHFTKSRCLHQIQAHTELGPTHPSRPLEIYLSSLSRTHCIFILYSMLLTYYRCLFVSSCFEGSKKLFFFWVQCHACRHMPWRSLNSSDQNSTLFRSV